MSLLQQAASARYLLSTTETTFQSLRFLQAGVNGKLQVFARLDRQQWRLLLRVFSTFLSALAAFKGS